jgi:uncharacterized protein YqjF (DUF2071 family)
VTTPLPRLVGRDVLFAHWPVDSAAVEPLVPDGLAVDRFDGSAWVSALVLHVDGLRIAGDRVPLPSAPQVLFRTYASDGDERGVVFLSCDTPGPAARLARRAFSLPIHRARVRLDRGDTVTVRSRRAAADARFDARYRPTGEATPAASGSLEQFLLERHAYYADDRVGRVDRDPWQLTPVEASVRTNTLWPDGLEPAGEPVFGYCPRFEPRFLGLEPLASA